MKKLYFLFLICLFLMVNTTKAQLAIDDGGWVKIDNLSPITQVFTDADNGDGANDGAVAINWAAPTSGLLGLYYPLSGTPLNGEQLTLEAKSYATSTSYVKLKMQVFNVTEGIVLAQSTDVTFSGTTVATLSLSYTFTEASIGDKIIVRIIRTDDLNVVRASAIDYLKVNGQLVNVFRAPHLAGKDGSWSKIENTNPVNILYTDADNGDGINDGAVSIAGPGATAPLQGIQCKLTGTPFEGEQINLEAKYYATSTSYVKLKMQVFNVTDNIVLAQSPEAFFTGLGTVATSTLSYVFDAASVGDQIIIRIVRTDDLSAVRVSALDYLKVNGNFLKIVRIPKVVAPQLTGKDGSWTKVESTSPISVLYTDADNGDGLKDGAVAVVGPGPTVPLQGVQCELSGSPLEDEPISLEAKFYPTSTSYIKLRMQLYNVTENRVLAESADVTFSGTTIGTASLSYVFNDESVGDKIIVRLIRTDDLLALRVSAVDYLKVNGQFVDIYQKAPLTGKDGSWTKIENTSPIAMDFRDADNGDQLHDGAIEIKGVANTPALQGLQCKLSRSPINGEQINLEAKFYATSTAAVKLKMQLYNVTDNLVLAESAESTFSGTTVATSTLSYTSTLANLGDQILIRIIRSDDLDTSRTSAVDYLKVNGQFVAVYKICKPVYNFDLPLTTATTAEINDLNTIRTRLSDQILGGVTSDPSTTALNTAITQYKALNIEVQGTDITGSNITAPSQVTFLNVFAKYLKFHPSDSLVIDMAVKSVWYLSSLKCGGDNDALSFYNYPAFGRSVIFLNKYLPAHVKALFGNTLFVETGGFKFIFDPTYDFETTKVNRAINTDHVYLCGELLFAYSDWFDTNDEKIRWLKTVKRYFDRALIYSSGNCDGLKQDGTGYHHLFAYDGYMYAFSSYASILKSLEDTNFQVDKPSYARFRDALYAQVMFSNDGGVRPLSLSGRHPDSRNSSLSSGTLSSVAISGGKILGLPTADPILAGLYNRKFGTKTELNFSTVAPFEQGYVQFNHANLGVYRKNNWIASMKGQSDILQGAEIYAIENRFGRYQSYGTLEVIYPGDITKDNGYSDKGWDWNYNPGATTIVLPWDKLQAEQTYVDEKNTYGFAGSLALNRVDKGALSTTMGQAGLFGMKFKELTGQGWGGSLGANTHNGTFEFTKAYFSIDDYIICLGSGIKNSDAVNPTVTTLFQRLNNNANDVIVNGEIKTSQSTELFLGTSPNWIIDNYNTGYYILPNSGTLKIRNSTQTTPYQNQVFPTAATIAANTSNNYHLAYLDHGNAPTDNSYEFVCIPSANASRMTAFGQLMQAQEKPYAVHQNNINQQIIEHKASRTWAYALPAANTAIADGLVKANDTPCLAMYKGLNSDYTQILLAVSNPDLGASPSTPKVITLVLKNQWNLSKANPGANIVTVTDTTTIVQFILANGLPVEIKLTSKQLVHPTIFITSPIANENYATPANITITTDAEATVAGASVSKVEFFQGNTKLGETLTSPFNFEWANPASGTYTITAKATDNLGHVTISDPINIVINVAPVKLEAAGDAFVRDGSYANTNFPIGKLDLKSGTTASGLNRRPFIQFDLSSLTNKFDDAYLRVTATSSLAEVSTTNWEFYEVTDNSWTETGITWNNQPAISTNLLATVQGKMSGYIDIPITSTILNRLNADKKLSIRVSSTGFGDNTNAAIVSRESLVIDQRPTLIFNKNLNKLPTVSITSPVANATVNAAPGITITTVAADVDGSITKVEFFQGETKIGEALTAPYNFNWSNAAAGSYTITAKVTDDSQAVTTSAAVNITVNASPAIAIISPLTNANYSAHSNVTISANATDADGTISKVEFFQGETKLGEALSAPYGFDWNEVATGSYVLSAKATDNNGAVSTSAVVNVNVVCPPVQVSIADVYALNNVIDAKNTIYIGYGPTSLSITALAQGAQDYTYSWNTGANTPSIVVSAAGTYTVTVTYAGGCQTTASITINTLDVRCGNNNNKVQICHNNKVICVAQEAVADHLAHGDKLGFCGAGTVMQTNKDNTIDLVAAKLIDVKVYPNPSSAYFTVLLPNENNEKTVLRVLDMSGRVVKKMTNISGNSIQFGQELQTGVYILEVKDGDKRTIVKLIKL